MPIIGFSINSIEAKKRRVLPTGVKVTTTPKITSVKEKKVEIVKEEKVLAVGFEFTIQYDPNVGKLKFVGEILYTDENVKEVLNHWKKRKKLPVDVDIAVKNFLIRKCLTVGVYLAENLQLPPPVILPVIRKRK